MRKLKINKPTVRLYRKKGKKFYKTNINEFFSLSFFDFRNFSVETTFFYILSLPGEKRIKGQLKKSAEKKIVRKN